MNEQSKFPLEAPYDDEVVFAQQPVVRLNPQGSTKKAKCCPVCSYPIHIRIVAYPCSHYFCYQCFQKNTYSCGFCGGLNSKTQRLPDNQLIYSCDNTCFKYFESQQQLKQHLHNHELLKSQ